MHRLIIQKDGDIVKDILLEAGEYTIGRDSKSAIKLNDSAISRHHARLIQKQKFFYIEDLESTNGTRLNDIQVTRQILSDKDLIQIGGFDLLYINNDDQAESADDQIPDNTAADQVPDYACDSDDGPSTKTIIPKVATVRFFRGPNKGQLETISRSLYTIGQPGGEVAAIARRPQGFFLLYIGGESYPKINSQEIDSAAGVQLKEGDVVEVGENLAEISLGGVL